MAEFDVLLRQGTVIDGTGQPRKRADVGITNARIAALGDLSAASAAHTLNVPGKIVAPGFVDTHNHSEGWLLKHPYFTPKLSQGFTTEVLMSDGISYAPTAPEHAAEWIYYLRSLNGLQLRDYMGWTEFQDYYQRLDRRVAQNIVGLAPYANLRVNAAGWRRDPLDDTACRQMQYLLKQALEQGAAGLSSGLDYIAQGFVGTDELVEACRPLAAFDALYITHIRYKKGLVPAVREAVEIGRRAGVRVHISHLKADAADQIEPLLDYLAQPEVDAVDLTFDVYPYVPGSTMLNSLLPYEVWEDGPLAAISKLNDRTLRRRFAIQLADYRLGLDKIHIAWLPTRDNQPWIGQSLADYIAARGTSAADALADLLIEENMSVLLVFHREKDDLVEPFLQHPRFMIGSDGLYFPGGQVHPRVFGSTARILGPLVRDRKLFTLEHAVHRLSGFPAQRFGMLDRGELREGAWADVVVFDPETIRDRATYRDPQQVSEGIERVFVNGRLVYDHAGEITKATSDLPGRYLPYRKQASGE